MHHHETPDQDGWYWVKYSDEDHYMAHFRAEIDDQPRLDVLLRDREGDYCVLHLEQTAHGEWEGREEDRPASRLFRRGPSSWVGPLSSPFGDFQGEITEFAEDNYRKACEAGLALVMLHVEFAGSDPALAAATWLRTLPGEDALEFAREFFGWRKAGSKAKRRRNGKLRRSRSPAGTAP